ncbi:MAG: hypothetical protein ACHQ4G_03935 [Opitutales bacterium]
MPPPEDEPSAAWKLLAHFLDEMSWPMLLAAGLLAFFFFYGATNGLIKLSGCDVASLDFPIGPVVGSLSGLLLIVVGAAVKLRSKR